MTLSDKRLRQHKNAAAGLAIGTSTLGIAALGSKGAAVGARRALKAKSTGLRKIPRGKLERVSAGADRAATNLTVTGAGLGGIGGYNFAAIQASEAKRRPRTVSKARRNTREKQTMIGTGGAALAGAAVLGRRSAKHFKKAGEFSRNAKNIDRQIELGTRFSGVPESNPFIQRARQTAQHSRRWASIERTDGAIAGTGAGALGAGGGALIINSQRPRKSRVQKNAGGVMDFGLSGVRQHDISKAYDPEKKRSRRLEGYQADLNIGAGALGAAAFASGRSAARDIRAARGKAEIPTGQLRRIGRKTAKTGALGLGAIGAAVAADRVGSYRKGRGRSYNALRG